MTTATDLHTAQLIIDGACRASSSGTTSEVRSPATGAVVGYAQAATRAEVDAAVAAATRAFAEWRALTAWKRERVIRAATAAVRPQADAIGRLMALEQGKPLKQSVGEVAAACDIIDYYASEGVRVEGSTNPAEKGAFRSLVIHQPVGVVAAITPWNYPIALLSWKLGPAFAAGCPVIVKPTPVTPLAPYAFCAALVDGGLPPGLLGFVTGDDVGVAQHLVTHPQVAKVAMTGSTATGRKLMSLCGPDFKRMTLELGGHCPAIVCADADLDATAQAIAYKAFRNMGQSCSSMNRIYAHPDIHDELVAKVVAAGEAMTIGDGLEPGDVDLGPMTTRATRDRVEAHVADALDHGAELHSGGQIPDDLPEAGNFYTPTVLTGCTAAMRLAREETFGPVAPFMTPTADLDEMVRQANDTEYGLAAYLFTRDLATAYRVSEALDHGTVCVNNVATNTPYAPYEGWKSSGVGVELSRQAIHEYLHRKHIKFGL